MALKMLMVAILSVFIFNFCTSVSAQANTPAPTPVTAEASAPGPSPAQEEYIIQYNLTWVPEECWYFGLDVDEEALEDILAEWNNTNTDIFSLLTGWSETKLNPCENVWQGIVCNFYLLNTTYDNGTKTEYYNISVAGLSITNTALADVLPPAIGNL